MAGTLLRAAAARRDAVPPREGPAPAPRPAGPFLAALGPRAWTCGLLLAAIAVLWMATRPYSGVVHDGRLYTLQALSAADPARFAEDLFLRFGSQDRFTVFSRLYDPVLRWAGVSAGAMLLTLLGQAAWLGGAFALASALVRDPVRALGAVAGLVALPAIYGAQSNFTYGEPFLSPRLFAEALTMLALGCAVRGQALRAGAALAAAGLFHPIMAAPGAAAFLFFHAFRDRRWWALAACAAAGAAGAAAMGVEPFARLGVRFDPVWFAVVRQRAVDVFIAGWSLIDCCILVCQLALAVLALALPGPDTRRLIGAVLLAAVGGLALTAVGADLARNQFLVNVQPWRATWLLSVIAHLLAVPLLIEFAGAKGAARPFTRFLLFGGIALLFLARLVPGAFLWSALLLAAAAVLVRRRLDSEPPGAALRVVAAGGAVVVAVSVADLGFATKGAMQVWPEEFWARLWGFGLGVAALGLAAAAVALRPGPSADGGAAPGPAVAAVAAFLLFCAALGWDQRPAWTKFVESPDPLPSDLAAFVPDGATAYWDAGVELLWFRLRKPSYHSCMQGAGVIFFRDTAVAYQHRAESFPFETMKSDRCWKGAAALGDMLTPAGLRRACEREPELDVIVLPHRVDGVPRREWRPPVALRYPRIDDGKLEMREFDRFYAYPCDALR